MRQLPEGVSYQAEGSVMANLVELFDRMGWLYTPCGDTRCGGIMMPIEDRVLCSETITAEIRDSDEGGSE